jgi:hypothetical protein
VRKCCFCGEEDIYKQLITLPVSVVYEGKTYWRDRYDALEPFICFDCLQEEAKNVFAI